MTDKPALPTVYIGETFTLDGKEVVVSTDLGIENMGDGLVGVVVKVLSDDVHIDPSAMRLSTHIVAGDDLYPTGRVDETIGYLKATRARVHARHVDTYGVSADRMPNEVLDVIDETLDRLGVPVVETVEVRTWGSNEAVATSTTTTTEYPTDLHTFRADKVILHHDLVEFVTDGREVEWVRGDVIRNMRIETIDHVTRVWPVDDPHHLGEPMGSTATYTTTEVTWDMVYNEGAYVVNGRFVTVDEVIVAPDVVTEYMSCTTYDVTISRETKYNDLDSYHTRDEYNAGTMATEEDEDNGE